MKAIVCEMCGGKDLLKDNGFFVCQNCGTKYTVEEARKLFIDGPVDVSGSVVKIDNSSNKENYYMLADNAFKSMNYHEAERYCNKIIEIDSNDYLVWLLKGKTINRLNSLSNLRTEEYLNCMIEGYNHSPEDKKDEVVKTISDEMFGSDHSLIRKCCNEYKKTPCENRSNDIVMVIEKVVIPTSQAATKLCIKHRVQMQAIASYITNLAISTWNDVYALYKKDKFPQEFQRVSLVDRTREVTRLINYSIDLVDDDKAKDIQRYLNLIQINSDILNAWSYKYNSVKHKYIKDSCLSSSEQLSLNNLIMNWKYRIKQLEPNYPI